MSSEIKIYVIVTRDDNGTGADVSLAQIQSAVDEANKVWAAAGLEFTFDTADFEEVNSTLLHNDTTPGDYWANAKERSRVATQHLGHVVIFIRDYDPQTSAGGNLSGGGDFIALSKPPTAILAHELGHYFHCTHTFGLVLQLSDQEKLLPVSEQIELLRDKHIAAIRTYVSNGHSKGDGLYVFDGDRPRVMDTPPDDGGQIFALLNGGNSGGPIGEFVISVDFGDGNLPTTYVLKPDRSNVMSYFPTTSSEHLSADQQAIVSATLANGNRKHLVAGKAWAADVNNQSAYAPSAVSWGPDRLDVFARGKDGRVYNKVWEPSRWWPSQTGWADLGGQITGSPVAVSWGPGRLDLFVRGTDGRVYNKVWEPSGWWPSQTGWADLGGQITSSPVAVSWGPGRLDLFARGTDGRVYNKVWEPSGWWPSQTGWADLGGQITGSPVAVSWGPGRIDLFALGTDGRVYNKVWEPSGWWPSQTGWADLGGSIMGSPVAVSWGPGRLDLFARGTDGRVCNKVWEPSGWWPSQTGWADLGTATSDLLPIGGAMVGSPTAATWGPGRLDVFLRGVEGRVYNKVWEPSRWWPSQTDWADMGPGSVGQWNHVIGLPHALSWGPGRLAVFARGLDGSVNYKLWTTHDGWWPGQLDWNTLGLP